MPKDEVFCPFCDKLNEIVNYGDSYVGNETYSHKCYYCRKYFNFHIEYKYTIFTDPI